MANKMEKPPFSRKLVHVGVVVKDMDKAIKRFESLGIGPFGLPESMPANVTMFYRGKPYKTGQSEQKELKAQMGDILLELWQPVRGESPWMEFLKSKGEGIHHVAFKVNGVDREAAGFIENGANILFSARTPDGKGGVYLDLGAGNIIVELEDI